VLAVLQLLLRDRLSGTRINVR